MMSKDELAQKCIVALRTANWYPYDTGNLKFNATYYQITPKGFDIIFDGEKADYIDFLEYGTKKSKQHVGFISEKSNSLVVEIVCNAIKGKKVY